MQVQNANNKSVPELIFDFNPLIIIGQTSYNLKLSTDEKDVEKKINNFLKKRGKYNSADEIFNDLHIFLRLFGIYINEIDFKDYCEFENIRNRLFTDFPVNDIKDNLNSKSPHYHIIKKLLEKDDNFKLKPSEKLPKTVFDNYIDNLIKRIKSGNKSIRINPEHVKYITPVNKSNCTINSSFNMYINYHIQCGTLDYNEDDDTNYALLEEDIRVLINAILKKDKEQIINDIVRRYLKIHSNVRLKTLYTQYFIFCLYVYYKSFIFRYDISSEFYKTYITSDNELDMEPLKLTYKSHYFGANSKMQRVSNKITQELLQVIFDVVSYKKLNELCIYNNIDDAEILLSSVSDLVKNKDKLSKRITSEKYTLPNFGFIKKYSGTHAYLEFEKYQNGHNHYEEKYIIDDLPGDQIRRRDEQNAYEIHRGPSFYEKNGFKKLERLSDDFWIVSDPDHFPHKDNKIEDTIIKRFTTNKFINESTDVLVRLKGGEINKYITMIIGLIIFIVIIVCIIVVIIKFANKDDVNSTKS